MLCVVTVNYYSKSWIVDLIRTLESDLGISCQLLIVNNSPDDRNITELQSEFIVVLESGRNIGFGCACNLALNYIFAENSSALVWLINPDAKLVEGAIETCTHLFSFYPNLSILGTTIYTPTNQPWFTGGRFIKAWGQILEQGIAFEDSDVDYQICDWVSGCSLILNLKQFKICPQFDPTYFLYYEDVDFCLRYQQQGHLIAITPKIQVTHHPSSITNQNLSKKFQYSTYGYLLTLHRYSPWPVLLLRLLRVGLYALLLWPCRPDISQGKLTGLWQYLTRD